MSLQYDSATPFCRSHRSEDTERNTQRLKSLASQLEKLDSQRTRTEVFVRQYHKTDPATQLANPTESWMD